MAVGKKEKVFTFPIHMEVFRIVFKNMEIKCYEEFGTAKRPSGMTGLGSMDHS
jgi:hypothetical protein